NKYKFKSSKRIRSHSVQEILYNEYAEIRVDTRIKTDVNIRCNRPDIFVSDKRKNKIPLIELRERALLTVILGAVRHKQPTPSLKEKKNKRDVVKQINTENIIPFVWMVLPL
ncbi:hypothetical protein CWI36_0859p0010, partial [Hamiltosporidium magnivora]